MLKVQCYYQHLFHPANISFIVNNNNLYLSHSRLQVKTVKNSKDFQQALSLMVNSIFLVLVVFSLFFFPHFPSSKIFILIFKTIFAASQSQSISFFVPINV